MSSIDIDSGEGLPSPRRFFPGRDETGAPLPPGMRILRVLLYFCAACAWFLIAFLGFLYATFPYDKARLFVAHQLEEATGFQAEMASLRPSLPDGLRVKGLKLFGKDKDTAKDPPFLTASTATLTASIPGLLTGRKAGTLDAEIYGGELGVELDQEADSTHFVLNAQALDFAQLPLGGEKWKLAGTGKLNLFMDLIVAKEVRKSSGQGNLAVEGLVLNGSQVIGVTLPTATFTEAGGKMVVDKGKLTFEETRFVSDVVEAQIEGYIMLNQSITRSRMSLKIKFKLRDDLDALAKLAMKNPTHRTDDGFYHYMATGTMESPRWREDRAAARREGFKGKRNARANRGDDDVGPGGDDDQGMSRSPRAETSPEDREQRLEELRKRREENRAKREERMKTLRESRARQAGDDDAEPSRSGRRATNLRDRVPEEGIPEDDPGLPMEEGSGPEEEEDYSGMPGYVEP